MSSPVPSEYADTLESIKRLVHRARYVAQRRVNTELLRLYWQIGATIIERQKTAPWGSKVLSRLSADLRTEFPGVKGFSPANLTYMRRFAEAWPDPDAIGQRPVGQLPWGHAFQRRGPSSNCAAIRVSSLMFSRGAAGPRGGRGAGAVEPRWWEPGLGYRPSAAVSEVRWSRVTAAAVAASRSAMAS